MLYEFYFRYQFIMNLKELFLIAIGFNTIVFATGVHITGYAGLGCIGDQTFDIDAKPGTCYTIENMTCGSLETDNLGTDYTLCQWIDNHECDGRPNSTFNVPQCLITEGRRVSFVLLKPDPLKSGLGEGPSLIDAHEYVNIKYNMTVDKT